MAHTWTNAERLVRAYVRGIDTTLEVFAFRCVAVRCVRQKNANRRRKKAASVWDAAFGKALDLRIYALWEEPRLSMWEDTTATISSMPGPDGFFGSKFSGCSAM